MILILINDIKMFKDPKSKNWVLTTVGSLWIPR